MTLDFTDGTYVSIPNRSIAHKKNFILTSQNRLMTLCIFSKDMAICMCYETSV